MTPRTDEEEEEEEEEMMKRNRPDLEEEPQGLLLNLERVINKDGWYFAQLNYYDVREIIKYYQAMYKLCRNNEHPTIKQELFLKILENIYFIYDEDGHCYNIVEWFGEEGVVRRYKGAIDIHFKTKYKGDCDYSIIHFFSGKIRLYRFKDFEKHEIRTNIQMLSD